MKIYVPSINRHSRLELKSGVLCQMPIKYRRKVIYVVPPEQATAYMDNLVKIGYPEVGVAISSSKGIAGVRRDIGLMADHRSERQFMMFDDDIRFVQRVDYTTVKLRQLEKPEEWDAMFAAIQLAFLGGASCVGISARGGNQNMGPGSPFQLRDVNTRLLRAFGFDTLDFLACEHERVTVMEDFDVFLQLLRKGKDIVNLGYWAQDQKQTNAPGGCSTYRTHAVHEESAKRLAELHAPHVRLRQKANKTGGAFGTRTEVTISWKRAAAEGKAQ